MDPFFGVPITSPTAEDEHFAAFDRTSDIAAIGAALDQGKLALLRATPFAQAGAIFRALSDRYGLTASYELQMQYVVTMMKDRAAVDDIAVTVNERGPFQIIQAHAEGDSTSPLDLFGLHCTQNAKVGGENILSLVDQGADHGKLRAKEKAVLAGRISPVKLAELRRGHLDAKDVIAECPTPHRVLRETPSGKIIVRGVPVRAQKSALSGKEVVTLWDNVTVHDRAFHHHHYELLRHMGILVDGSGGGYEQYMHIEDDSPWSPIDTESGDVAATAKLFSRHYLYKMQADDFLLFDNRIWTHAVNNWDPADVRKLTAMYA